MRLPRILVVLSLGLMLGAWCGTSAAQTPQYYNYDNGVGSNSFPLNVSVGKDVQLLYRAGEFNQPSAASAGTITSVSVHLSSSVNATFTDLTIKLGQSTITDLTDGTFYSGSLTQVYYRSSVALTAESPGWLTFVLDTPFAYDPTQSLIVDIGQCGFTGTGATVSFTANSGVRRIWSVAGCPFVAYASSGSYNYDFGITLGGSTAPTATTGSASSVTVSGATLNGTVNANGSSTTVTFEYGPTTAYGSSATASQSPVTGTSDTAVSAAITGLTQNSTYHFRVVGVSSGGTTYGDDATFTTSATPASVTTGSASSVTTTGATLNGSVNANGNSTTVTFEYGATTAYGSSATASQSPVTGSSATAVSAAITGLSQNSTYHFRAVGVSVGGTVYGDDATFATPAATAIPALGGWALILLGVLVALAAAYALR